MKKKIIIACGVIALCASTLNASWFQTDEKNRRIETEQKLIAQTEATGTWQLVAFGLGVVSIIALVGGTIIGSRAKRHAEKTNHRPK